MIKIWLPRLLIIAAIVAAAMMFATLVGSPIPVDADPTPIEIPASR